VQYVQVLWLHDNKIGDHGLAALAGALGKGGLDKVTYLRLDSNKIGDAGLQAFADALVKGALDQLQVCWRPTAL